MCNKRVDEVIYSYGKEHGMNREDVAGKLGIRAITLSRRLSGDREWKVKELATLADISGVDFNEFFEEVD